MLKYEYVPGTFKVPGTYKEYNSATLRAIICSRWRLVIGAIKLFREIRVIRGLKKPKLFQHPDPETR